MSEEGQQAYTGETIRLELPEEARITAPLIPAGEIPPEVLGATGVPGGVEVYGGSNLDAYMSADGTLFLIYCGERGAGYKFGSYCLRYWKDGRREWVELPAFTEGRVGVVREPDGLYLAWPLPGGRAWERVKVPGYVTPGFPSSGQQVVAPVSIVTTPPPGQFKDTEAHALIATLKKQVNALETLIKAQATTIQQLRDRPTGGLSWPSIRDHLWGDSIIQDKVYADLSQQESGIKGIITQVVVAEVTRQLAAAPQRKPS